MPLGKLALGAEGHSLDELLSAIGVLKKSMISSHFKPLILELRYLPGVKLDIASKLYISINSRLHRAFSDQAKDIFDSSAEKIDFQYPTYAAEEINSWVSLQTNGLIKDIVSPIDVPPSTSLVLVNGVYFSGKWKDNFDKVKNMTFHSPNGQITVPMMIKIGHYNYSVSDALGSRLVQIPYNGDKASLLLVLPTSRTGLSVLLSQLKLAPELLDSALSRMELKNLQLIMPKFKIESQLNLNAMYLKVGVKKIFDNVDSGLTKIVRDESLHVTNAKQKAFIEVNEFGTEAAGSSVVNTMKFAYQKPSEFKADHPFLFLILVKGQQLFSGTVVNLK
ncbi:antichymotrypsin-2-like [Vanessa tameamea]|uniref:Antichymotrypsin-2-like n=1 Tax=Vanessa tameamea TaxID=334116 RepID=A0ABM4AJ09_VANTA